MPPRPASPDRSVAICVLAYQATSTIEAVLERIPALGPDLHVTVLVADDASTDDTAAVAQGWAQRSRRAHVEVVTHARNLGYGGNQVACMEWARARGIGIVAMLHGDGQYPPEALGDLVAPIASGRADAVFGSRMIEPGGARAGGMPLGRRVGNRVLSALQNALVGTQLSEWHSGLRAYRVAALDGIHVDSLPSGFEIDTVATLRLVATGATIEEIAIPTRYAGETSRIRPVRDGLRILAATVRHRLHPFVAPTVEVAS